MPSLSGSSQRAPRAPDAPRDLVKRAGPRPSRPPLHPGTPCTDRRARREAMREGLERVAAATLPSPLGPPWMLHRTDPLDGSSVTVIGPQPTIAWAVPSPTGARIAVGLSVDRSEDATVRVIDVASGALLPDALRHMLLSRVNWLPDGSGCHVLHAAAAMIDGRLPAPPGGSCAAGCSQWVFALPLQDPWHGSRSGAATCARPAQTGWRRCRHDFVGARAPEQPHWRPAWG